MTLHCIVKIMKKTCNVFLSWLNCRHKRNQHKTFQAQQRFAIVKHIVVKLDKGENVSLESLRKICIALGCAIGDIMEVDAVIGWAR